MCEAPAYGRNASAMSNAAVQRGELGRKVTDGGELHAAHIDQEGHLHAGIGGKVGGAPP